MHAYSTVFQKASVSSESAGGLGPICAAGRELRLDVGALRTGVLEDVSGLKHFLTSHIGAVQSKMANVLGQYLQV
jgi:hypothetical protein